MKPWKARVLSSRPPDRADMNTTAQVNRSSRQAKAYDLTNVIFNALRPYLGQNVPMPMVYFTNRIGPKGVDMRTYPVATDAVTYPRGYHGGYDKTGVVAYPAGLGLLNARGKARMQGIDILIHELAHTQQNPALLNLPQGPARQAQIEGGAEAFTELVRDSVARMFGIKTPPYRPPYGPAGADFLKRYGRSYALRGQFRGR